MPKVIKYPLQSDFQPLPGELLKRFRIRSGLTQPKLAKLLELKNDRMIRNWENGSHLPGPERLQKLIEIYLLQDVFLPQQEQAEARQLWNSVKAHFETAHDRPEHFPRFDENWFEQMLLQQRQPSSLKGDSKLAINSAHPAPNPAHQELAKNQTTQQPLPAQPKRRDNLPVPPNRFIGRQKELEQALALLANKSTRLLTFTGPGGTGKTRMALETAARAQLNLSKQYPDGVWLVELAQLDDPRLVTQTVALTLGIKEVPGRPLEAAVLEQLRDKALLLILDNCEHLVDECAHLVQALTQACPDLQLLATSREILGIAADTSFEVFGLALLDTHSPQLPLTLENMRESEAVKLFVERASVTVAGFSLRADELEAVFQICQRLDGLPLALELAAAQVRTLGVKQIAERLYHLPLRGSRTAQPRQQTMRASIEWSYTLLNSQEQQLLQRLTVFRGGWLLEAAEAVCNGEGIEVFEILELLTQLVNKSLVVAQRPLATASAGADEVRYRLLETIRQYSEEKAQYSNLYQRYQYRHALFYLNFIEKINPKLLGEQQGEWILRLDQEQDNLRIALSWLMEQAILFEGAKAGLAADNSIGSASDFKAEFSASLPELALRLAGAMWRLWYTQGRFSEGRRWLEAALLISPASPSREIAGMRAKVLSDAAKLAWLQGASTLACSLAQESVDLYRKLEDKAELANSLTGLAQARLLQGEYEQATDLLKESLRLFDELANLRGRAIALHNLGWVALLRGNYAKSIPILQESLALFRQSGDGQGTAHTQQNLGRAMAFQGDYNQAKALLGEALSLARQVGSVMVVALCLESLGEVALLQHQDYSQATKFLQEGLKLFYALGLAARLSSSMEMLAYAAILMNLPERAVRLCGAAQRLHDEMASPIAKCELPRYEQTIIKARHQLAPDVFTALWEEGRALTLEQAVSYALEQVSPNPAPSFSSGKGETPGLATPSPIPEATPAQKLGLTSREVSVLELVVQGLTNAEVAQKLIISPHTVNSHLTSIYSKLGVSSRAEAIRYALEHHLI